MQLDWLNILGKIFDIAIFPILTAATLYLVTLIKAKKQELIEKTKNERTKEYIEMLDRTIVECVLATSQTYVEALKKEGSFDTKAQKKAFQLTYDTVMSILTDDVQEYLNETVKDLSTYITTKIESQIVFLKQQPK